MNHPDDCLCCGAGWVWAHELTPPFGDNPMTDDTKYPCPYSAVVDDEDEIL